LVATLFIALGATAQICNLPAFPPSNVTNDQDRTQMECQLGVTEPTLPSKLVDPNAPPNTYPKDSTQPEGDWRNAYGHTISRSAWGLWNNYEDTLDSFLPNGSDSMTLGSPDSWRVYDYPVGNPFAPYSRGEYTPIDLLKMDDGTPVLYPEDWWTKRRPEILRDLQNEMYGVVPDKSLWPTITWTVGAVTTGSQVATDGKSYQYKQRTITGTIDVSSYPSVRTNRASPARCARP
jgi:hypothetical protein